MKILGRTLIILLAALLVVGATMALDQAGYLPLRGEGMPDRARFEAERTAGATDGMAQRPHYGRSEGGHAEGMGLFGAVEVGKNLGIIGVIVAAGALLTGLAQRIRPRMRGRQPPPGPAS